MAPNNKSIRLIRLSFVEFAFCCFSLPNRRKYTSDPSI